MIYLTGRSYKDYAMILQKIEGQQYVYTLFNLGRVIHQEFFSAERFCDAVDTLEEWYERDCRLIKEELLPWG